MAIRLNIRIHGTTLGGGRVGSDDLLPGRDALVGGISALDADMLEAIDVKTASAAFRFPAGRSGIR